MSTLIVPALDEAPWPTLGPQVADLIEERCVFGPGSLKGQPARLDAEKRAVLYRLYEVYPQGHPLAGRRRFKRGGVSWRKGLAKTEFGAWVTFAELHPEGPVRCDGFDADGDPVGRPVVDPYIPMLAVTAEQVEELAYGALKVMCEEGPDAELFDVSLERIIRFDEFGRADGKAVPLANSPGSRDGARTTFQFFDEPHRLFLPRQKEAHETMVANLEKRVLEDPWGLYVGTAGEPGEDSVAEGLHNEALLIDEGQIDDPQLCYVHREAGQRNSRTGRPYDLTDLDERVEAVAEATGPVGEYGPGQFLSIARQWDRPSVDKTYLERVWLNRWTRSEAQAFDVPAWRDLAAPPIADGALVTVGFDGARFRDSTALVVTDVESGTQRLYALWERPVLDTDDSEDGWEVPEDEVTEAVAEIHKRYEVALAYADPAHWTETVGAWSGKYPGTWVEWWTGQGNVKRMAYAVRAYAEGIQSGAVLHEDGRHADLEEALERHVAAAGRKEINLYDDEGRRLFVLKKLHADRRLDAGMAAVLSWRARLDAQSKGIRPKRRTARPPRRIR